MVDNIDDKLKKIVNSSGFPLQIALESLIKNSDGAWKVHSKEHPWENTETGGKGFIDLIISNYRAGKRLVIECKRVRDIEWIFLSPAPTVQHYDSLWMTKVKSGLEEEFGWSKDVVNVPSLEASFCAIQGQDKKRQLLETIGSELVEATEALAQEEHILYRRIHGPTAQYTLRYFPVIVTTAELRLCKFDPADIDVKNGDISNATFETVPLVRFRKSLTNKISDRLLQGTNDVGEIAQAKERTIFVLNASKAIDVLSHWF